MSETPDQSKRTNFLCEYVPQPHHEAGTVPPVDFYTPTRATLVLCHALRVTLETLDATLPDVEPDGMSELCGELTEALRLLNVIEAFGLHEDEPIWVDDNTAWFDFNRIPPAPQGWVSGVMG